MHETTTVCGVGPSVGLLVRVLEYLTGQSELGKLTLLELERTVSGGQGLVKRFRSWCPVCYFEHQQKNVACYDRLLWMLQPITRCPIHKIRLLDRCLTCGALQSYYHRSGKLNLCAACSGLLVPHLNKTVPIQRPQFGESHCCDLVLSISRGDLYVKPRAIHIFRRELSSFLGGNELHLAGCELFDRYCSQQIKRSENPFRFSTLLRIANYLDIRLIDLLTAPNEAARAAGGLLLEHANSPREHFSRLTKDQRRQIRARIALELAKPYGQRRASKSQMAKELHVSINALRYAGSDLLVNYEDRRQAAAKVVKAMKSDALQAALIHDFLPIYLTRKYRTRKLLASALAKKCSVSVRVARQAVDEALQNYRASKICDEPRIFKMLR